MVGSTITITDNVSGDNLFTATWEGTEITTEIQMGTYYKVSVSSITGYLACADQSYTAGYQTVKNITFLYRGNGVFIEATDGRLYTSSNWDSNKAVNSFVLISTDYKFRIATTVADKPISNTDSCGEIRSYLTECNSDAKALADNDGVYNTNQIIKYLATKSISSSDTNYAAQYCKNYQFPNLIYGYLGSAGEMYALYSNFGAFNQCRTACGLSAIVLGDKSEVTKNLWTSTLGETTSGYYWRGVHVSSAGLITWYATAPTTYMVVPLGTYE